MKNFLPKFLFLLSPAPEKLVGFALADRCEYRRRQSVDEFILLLLLPILNRTKSLCFKNCMKRILIIDDDHAVLEALEEVLQYSGYDVKTIAHTEDIFKVINLYQPDLILVDYILSGINGGEICDQIKTNPTTSYIPVIIISGHSKVLRSLGDYGSDVIMEKPFDLNELLDKVSFCINRSQRAANSEALNS
jgi:PleD family two-component response regulator